MDDMREFTELTESEASEFTRYSVGWHMRDYIKQLTNGFVLEVGCGNGHNTGRYLHDQYLGIDVSKPLVDAAQKLHPNHKFLLYDGSTIPFGDAEFDTVICVSVLSHLHSLEDARQVLREIVRVSKLKAVILFTNAPTLDDPTKIRTWREPTHFGHTVWSNHYNITDLISGIVGKELVHIHPQHNTVWEIFNDEYSK